MHEAKNTLQNNCDKVPRIDASIDMEGRPWMPGFWGEEDMWGNDC